MKSMPFGVVYDYYCFINNIPVGGEYLAEIKDYENKVLSKRG